MLLVTLLWGTNFVAGKFAMEDGLSPNFYTAIRFCGAFVILTAIYWKRMSGITKKTLWAGGLIGIAVGVGYILQTIGLSMTTAAKTGFLTGLYVVLVPVLNSLWKRILPAKKEIAGVATATLGLAVLSLNRDFTMGFGDILVFISAVSFAISIILISHFASQEDPVVLAVLQVGVTAVLSFLLGIFTEPVPMGTVFTGQTVLVLGYSILFCTAINTVVQNVAQSQLSPITAALILVFEPVFAGFFAFLILGEALGLKELSGSFLIILGMLITLIKK